MNQAKKSAVEVIPYDSVEFSLVQSLCAQTSAEENDTNTKSGKWNEFRNVLMKVTLISTTIGSDIALPLFDVIHSPPKYSSVRTYVIIFFKNYCNVWLNILFD